jgi:hypothetical protein
MVISPDENGDFTGNPISVANPDFRMNINHGLKTRLPGAGIYFPVDTETGRDPLVKIIPLQVVWYGNCLF